MRRPTACACLSLLLLAPLGPRASQAGDAAKGRVKSSACAGCHGLAGISTLPEAPHLAGQPEAYVAEQLKAYRGGKRVHEAMSIVAKGLSDQDIADLAAWYSSIAVRAEPPNP